MNKHELKKMLSELWYYEHINDVKTFSFQKSDYINHFYFADIDLTVVEDDDMLYFYNWLATNIWRSVRWWYKNEMSITNSNYMFYLSLYNFNKQWILELKKFYKFERKDYPSEAVWLASKIRLLFAINPEESIHNILYQCIDWTQLINYNSTYISNYIKYSISLNASWGTHYTLDVDFSEVWTSNILMWMHIWEMNIDKLNHLNQILNTYFFNWFDFFNSKRKTY